MTYIFTFLWLQILPAGIQLDLSYADCRVMFNEAVSERDTSKLVNVLTVCRAIRREGEQ